MKLASELSYNMFKVASIFSIISVGHGDVFLTPSNPSNERGTCKGKVEATNLRCSTLHKEFIALQ